MPKQSGPPSSSPSPPTFHFIEPLIRHLGQPTSCVLQAVSCQKSTVILPHPSQNVSSYSFLTSSPASNDLQPCDLATLYEMCPFSCLFPKPNFSPSSFHIFLGLPTLIPARTQNRKALPCTYSKAIKSLYH